MVSGSLSPLREPLNGGLVKPSMTFIKLLAAVQAAVILCFQFVDAPDLEAKPAPAQLYNFYIGVSLMMFVGFGYLMTFLRWYGLGAVGLTMLVTALGVEVSLLTEPLFSGLGVVFDLMALLNANFAVAAFLISFGAWRGSNSALYRTPPSHSPIEPASHLPI